MRKEKEENLKKIRNIMDNRNKYNFEDENANIFDLDEFLLGGKKPEIINKINIDKNRKPIIDKRKEEKREIKEIKEKNINEINKNIVDINKKNENIINKVNELKKDKIKKKQINILRIFNNLI